MSMIYADGVDVHAGGNVRASHNWMRSGGSGTYDIRAFNGLRGGICGVYGDSEALGHVRTKFFTPGNIATVGAGQFQLSNAGNCFQLGPGLAPGSDNGCDSRIAQIG